ncbi:MOSC domain-containing protein [Chloroflexota bacterium]
MAEVIAVCKSRKKGTKKESIPEGLFKEGHGLINDAHADSQTHRQVSLLAIESIDKMRNLGFDLGPGDFGENITAEGIDLVNLPIGTRVFIGNGVVLEITQIGKECHAACAIRRQIGQCIMPEEGVFARVSEGGLVKPGDIIKIGGASEGND